MMLSCCEIFLICTFDPHNKRGTQQTFTAKHICKEDSVVLKKMILKMIPVRSRDRGYPTNSFELFRNMSSCK